MAHNKEGHHPVVRSKTDRGAMERTPDMSIYPTPTNSKDLRPGAKRFDISSTLAAIRETGKLRPGKRNSRNS